MDSATMTPIETEKKYRLTDAQRVAMPAAIEELGGAFEGEDFEENILFSNAELLAERAVLRLRRIGDRTILTYKRALESAGGAKRHVEHETTVGDFDTVAAIFSTLGFAPSMVYEKRRRKWSFRKVEIVIDELPFGDFMEIEGALTSILEAELLLGADVLTVEDRTYPVLTAEYGRRDGDLIVARFQTTKE